MPRRDPNELLVLALYFLAVVLAGSLLAPWLFLSGKNLVASGKLDLPGLHWLHDALDRGDFSRYFNRAVLITALVLLFPILRFLRIGRQGGLGLQSNPVWFPDLLAGFLLASGFLLLLGGILLRLGYYVPENEPRWDRIPPILLRAPVIGLLEEWFFRGAILALFLRTLPTLWAVFSTTFLYAVLHFLKPPDSVIAASEVTWLSGFQQTASIFHRFVEPVPLVAEFLTLFLIGWILASTRLRTRSLWLAIGLHTGWVFGLQLYQALTDRSPALREAAPWLGENLKTGLVPLAVVLLTGFFAKFWVRLSRSPQPESP